MRDNRRGPCFDFPDEGKQKMSNHHYHAYFVVPDTVANDIPEDYIKTRLANQFMDVIKENIDYNRRRLSGEYAVSHTAEIFLSKPSLMFKFNNAKKGEELVELDYYGFKRRIAVPENSPTCYIFKTVPMISYLGDEKHGAFDQVEKLHFRWQGGINAVGERIFIYESC